MRSCLFRVVGFIVVFWAKQHFRVGRFVIGFIANILDYALERRHQRDVRIEELRNKRYQTKVSRMVIKYYI